MANSAYSWNPAPDPTPRPPRSAATDERRQNHGNAVRSEVGSDFGRDVRRDVGNVVLEGQVRNVDKRMPINNRSVVHFRVEQFDSDGGRRRMVPVQFTSFGGLFGKDFAIHDGDRVRVHGQWDTGSIVARRVENFTTGAATKAPKPFGLGKVLLAGAAVLLIPLVIFAIAIFGFGSVFEDHNDDITSGWCQDIIDAGMTPPASQCGKR